MDNAVDIWDLAFLGWEEGVLISELLMCVEEQGFKVDAPVVTAYGQLMHFRPEWW